MLIENRPTVSSELFDDEVVIVNLENGNYYSFGGSGIDIWKIIKDGVDLPNLKEIFENKYMFDQDQKKVFSQIINELIEEGLVVKSKDPSDKVSNELIFKHDSFKPAILKKFTDMQDLLLLDPIHDVDATGWPMPKENPSMDLDTNKDV
ncbi:hypothetical protein N6H18_01560 [Reichenbachiella agarivorans]|uniref:Coenzyme PQQ synthesis protein D (PqqD) n=1 Tax=Reichenbachiella agarivorans TaxID=2979464 RepID=A0ABY6CWM9_9BACT|nr:hypothetical protein [Reichenbachiella agarivorans]UXP32655.1 hypothetical protein N6H18_01560 [Reichenbachiella agarivorans]